MWNVLIQVGARGAVVCRWRDKAGDQDDNKSKVLGKATLPLHLKLVQKGKVIEVFTSADGANWWEPLMSHPAKFDTTVRIGVFTGPGSTVVSATDVLDAERVSD